MNRNRPDELKTHEKDTMKAKHVILMVALLGPAVAAHGADVEALWKKNCMSCHGKDGKGRTKAGRIAKVKDFTDAEYQKSFTDEKAIQRLIEGIEENGKQRMKPFGEKLSKSEMNELLAYVRQFAK